MSKGQGNASKQSGKDKNSTFLGPVATIVNDVDTGAWRVDVPVVNHANCIRCAICKKHCPLSIIKVDKENPVWIDMRFCKGCGICAQVCPKGCIQMDSNIKEVENNA